MDKDSTGADLRSRIEQVEELPALPEVADQLLRVKDDPKATAKDVAQIIQLDPLLAGQVMRLASAPYLGFREEVTSIREAITRLGFTRVTDLALGLSAGGALTMPTEGPIGLKAFWRHAVHTAALMQLLAKNVRDPVRPGIAYLSGLLHNVGFLLLGHLFEEEFLALARSINDNPDRPITDLEREQLGIDHTEVGVWLMRKWRMPPEVVTTVFEHHNTEYRGDHHIYANLALVADRLLKGFDMGDASSNALPERTLLQLGIQANRAQQLAESLMSEDNGLDGLADSLAKGRRA